MSILTSTGTGLSGKIYINNINFRLSFIAEYTYVLTKYGIYKNSETHEFHFRPVVRKESLFDWIKKSNFIVDDMDYKLDIKITPERAVEFYKQTEGNQEEFVNLIKEGLYKILHNHTQDIKTKYIQSSGRKENDFLALSMESEIWGTADIYPETKSANDYV